MLEENELYDKALKIANGEIKYKETIPYSYKSGSTFFIEGIKSASREIEYLNSRFPFCITRDGIAAFEPDIRFLIVNTDEISTDILEDSSIIGLFIMPKVIKIIGEEIYFKVKYLWVHRDNPFFATINNAIFNKDITELLFYSPLNDSTTFKIPESVIKINKFAFKGVKHLRTLYVPKNISLDDIDITPSVNIIRY